MDPARIRKLTAERPSPRAVWAPREGTVLALRAGMRSHRFGALFSSLLAVALAAVAAACDGTTVDRQTTPNSNDDAWVKAVTLEWFAGECLGYCRGTTDVEEHLAGTYVERPWRENAEFPPRSETFQISAAQWANIRALGDAAIATPWEPRYGCPDCADGGGWNLTVRTSDGGSRTTVLDNQRAANPAALEALLEAVHGLTPDKPLDAISGS